MSQTMDIVSVLFVLGLTSVPCTVDAYTEDLPNVGYVLRGYHLYHGNPLATQVTSDPGFRNVIFDRLYTQSLTSADLKYQIPDGTIAHPKSGCTQAFSHETIQSSEEYQRLLQDMIKTNYSGFDNSFHGSSDYKHIDSTHSKDHTSQLLMAQIICSKYEASLNTVDPPIYTEAFVENLKEIYAAMQRDLDYNATIHDFLNTFGTHYVRKLELGSRLNFQYSLSSLDRYNLEQAGIDPRSGAIYSMTKKMGHQLTEEELRHSRLFDKLISGSKSSSSASYNQDGNLDVLNSVPIPLYYEIDRIDNLLVKSMMKSAGVDYKSLKRMIGNYFDNYCAFENHYSGVDRCPTSEAEDDTSALAISGKNFKVVFPESGEGSSTNHVMWRQKLPEMTAFTVSWWMKTSPYTEASNNRRHILSYNCNQVDHLKILAAAETQGGCLSLQLDGEPLVGGSNCLIPFDNNYHHYVVTWSTTYGRWQVYIDGNVMDGGSSSKGLIIPEGGYLVVGQQHHSGSIIENSLTAFQGEIAYLNMWDFSVNGVEARNLATANGVAQGNVVQWDQGKVKFSGEGLDVRAVTLNDDFFKI